MKVAIFENEFNEMKPAFDGFNLLYFNKSLDYEVFQSSQSFGDLKYLSSYDYLLMDIDLSVQSQMDGFQLMTEILKDQTIVNLKPIILTGQPLIKEKLRSKKLPEFPIINKPLVYTQINDSFQKAKPIESYR
jgi:CheY-like chemotaxis protein